MIKKITLSLLVSLLLVLSAFAQKDKPSKTTPPIYISFHWHMHQPIYMPYENVIQTHNSNVYSYSLFDVFFSRTGPYTDWPKNAVQKGITAGLPNFGAQVSFSGSLVENLNNLEAGGKGFTNWKSHWNSITAQKTTLDNPRLDMVAFGYHHPLMGLIDYWDIRRSIQSHKALFAQNFPNYTYSKGIFPPENAFSSRMVEALVDEGLQWAFVDNFNFERAAEGCPMSDATGVLRPNKADVINQNPNDWKQLNGLWAPAPVSAQWSHQPHWVQYVNPLTGKISKMIAVPTSRYLGNEDGRGGFGALNYETVMSQLEATNTDPNHPILIILHHDGDNYGGGTDSYYGSNFQAFTDWVKNNPSRFVCTTVQDYLEMFPPAEEDVIHVQDGSWVGADSGDPEFKKWNGDLGNYMGTPNYSPDRNSWGIVTAANNIVQTAQQTAPESQSTADAWKYYLNSQTSCYWYWDGTEMWDSHPARACNLAVAEALKGINPSNDLTKPSIYVPQREPYNPGEIEWGTTYMPTDFKVWTYAFDYSGLTSVKLKYRTDADGKNDLATTTNETYAGGEGVGEWQEIEMTSQTENSITNPLPTYKAQLYSAQISGMSEVLLDYYVEAIDTKGNVAQSDIQHVWVGKGSGGSGGGGTAEISWLPENPTLNEMITVSATFATAQTLLHWGVNASGSTWTTPIEAYRPANSNLSGTAVQTPFTDPDGDGKFTVVLGPFNNASQIINTIDFVIKDGSTWYNNGGKDFHVSINNNAGIEPVGSNNTVSTFVNTDYTFSQNNFYFIGINGAAFAGIKIISEETAGDLEYNQSDVTPETDYADVTQLVFKPQTDAIASPYASFTFKVKDNQGNYSLAIYTMTINVLSPNPTGASSSVTLFKDNSYNFSNSNFAFKSNAGATFAGIEITELNTKGTLTYNGQAAALNQTYSDMTLLAFTPATAEIGVPYTSFKFKVKDNANRLSSESYTMGINVIENIPDGISWIPTDPTKNDVITVFVKNDAKLIQYGGKLHWGVNAWQKPIAAYQPQGTVASADVVATPLTKDANDASLYSLSFGPFNNTSQNVSTVNFVINYGNNTWNNNSGKNWNISFSVATQNQDIENTSKVEISPNPFVEYTFISINDPSNDLYKVQLLDLSGRVIKQELFEGNSKYVLYRNNLKQGLYILQFVHNKSGKTFSEKIIIH